MSNRNEQAEQVHCEAQGLFVSLRCVQSQCFTEGCRHPTTKSQTNRIVLPGVEFQTYNLGLTDLSSESSVDDRSAEAIARIQQSTADVLAVQGVFREIHLRAVCKQRNGVSSNIQTSFVSLLSPSFGTGEMFVSFFNVLRQDANSRGSGIQDQNFCDRFTSVMNLAATSDRRRGQTGWISLLTEFSARRKRGDSGGFRRTRKRVRW